MMEEVAQALARLGRRERFTGARELVFCDEVGRHLVYKSLRERYKATLEGAQLRDHDLPWVGVADRVGSEGVPQVVEAQTLA